MQLFRLFLLCLACVHLAGCEDNAEITAPPQQVRAVRVTSSHYEPEAGVTGEVKARVRSDLSFRVSGRVAERRVDVGMRVRAGDVLARIEDTEQRADVDVAQAALDSARATVKQKTLTFERYKTLLHSQAIAQAAYDTARQERVTAQSVLEAAEATLATAQDALSHTELKADADGIITARTTEVGQVVSAAQTAFTLAHDGPREAVFDLYETFFLEGRPHSDVDVALVVDPDRKAKASIREVSPAINTRAGTIRVKVALPEASWPLGTPVVGQFRSARREGLILPSSAIASAMGAPAVWVVDTATCSVSLREVSVARYRTSDFIVTGGIAPQDLIVTEGGKFLKEGQAVAWEVK